MEIVAVSFLSICIIAGFVILFSHKSEGSDFFLSKNFSPILLGVSAGATGNSGFIVVGAVGMGYTMGLQSLTYPFAWLLGDLLFWFIFAKRIQIQSQSNKILSVPQLVAMGDHDSARLFTALAGIVIVLLLLVYIAAQFDAVAKSASSFIDLDSRVVMLITLVTVMTYSVAGGFVASVWTDFIQGVCMLLLTTGVVVWAIIKVGGPVDLLVNLSVVDPALIKFWGGQSLWPIMIFVLGFAFAGFGFSISQPQVTTRIMAGRCTSDVDQIRWTYIVFLHYTWMGMCVIGMCARLIMPDLDDPEKALPAIANQFFSPVFSGAVLVGILATIFSSLDSLLVSCSNTFSLDVLNLKVRKESHMWGHRLTMLVIGVLAVFLIFNIQSTVFQIALFSATVLAASIGSVVFITVLDWPRTNISLVVAMLTGLVTALVWRIFGLNAMVSDGIIGFIAALFAHTMFLQFKRKK